MSYYLAYCTDRTKEFAVTEMRRVYDRSRWLERRVWETQRGTGGMDTTAAMFLTRNVVR